MVVYTWHHDFMSALVNILEYVRTGLEIPNEVFNGLTPQEQAEVRTFENNYEREREWRGITLSILRTATDLSRGQDRWKVLEKLVHSSRSIIRSDIAYISLNNPSVGVTEVLTTSGVITEEFRNIRIPLGVGVMGKVAATKQAAWTQDQAQDPKVTHIPEVDTAVQAEGIRGILGAPLVSNGEMIGALMVGDRRVRSYTADEVVILDSLASLASVALETAQLIQDLEENIAALRKSHLQREQHVKQLEALSDSDSQFMDVLAKGAKPRGVRDIVREKLDCEAWFWRDDKPYSVDPSEAVDIPPAMTEQMQELISQSQLEGTIATGGGFSALAISLNQRHLGAICVNRVVEDTQAPILHRASQTFATIILFREAVLEAESKQINDSLRKVVTESAIEEDFLRIKQKTGIDLRDTTDLFLVTLKTRGSLPSARLLESLLGDDAVLFEHRDHLCALIRAPFAIDKSVQNIFDWARSNGEQVFAGAVLLKTVESGIIDAHSRALALATSMISLGLSNQVATASTFGSLGLLLGSESEIIEQIIADGIGKLVEYDEKYRTELTMTAVQFFDSGRSVSVTAKALYVHENTVRQRIDRITAILGDQWNSGPRAFDTHLALRAWKIKTSRQVG